MKVKEDIEVAHSGHSSGSGYVKTAEIQERNASKNADEPIQNNSSESDKEEDREDPPVHTDIFSERKRKSSAASSSNVSTTPRTRKKVKSAKTQSTTGFDERCNQLLQFKDKFGHCNVPYKYVNNPSLGKWCSNMRTAYNKIQKGMKANCNHSQDRIERLEEIGFQLHGVDQDEAFKKHCRELIAFKEDFGHCHVPQNMQTIHHLDNGVAT